MPFVYPIHCTEKDCANLAQFKVASRWSDGITEELKTFGLVCRSCLPQVFRQSLQKYQSCRLSVGEELDEPGIYEFEEPGKTGHLQHASELEAELRQPDSPN